MKCDCGFPHSTEGPAPVSSPSVTPATVPEEIDMAIDRLLEAAYNSLANDVATSYECAPPFPNADARAARLALTQKIAAAISAARQLLTEDTTNA